jgi:2-dehydropantoate 2-reductase
VSSSERDIQLTIAGTGAMACLLGAHLSSVARVTLTGTWNDGIEAVRRGGIVVEDSRECRVARVSAVPWGQRADPADLVLILVKAWQTERVARGLLSLLKPEGIAFTLQNGLGNLETLGPRTSLGVTYLGATQLGPGRVRPGGTGPTWIAGPGWVVDLFRRAGIPAEQGPAGQVDSMLWGKLATNCGINALTALLRLRNGELLERPAATDLLRRAASECAAVAQAAGVSLPFPDAAERACEVARLTAGNLSSMLQDVLRGARTECEAINGALVRQGERLGVPTPVNEVLLQLLRALIPMSSNPTGTTGDPA